MASEPHSPAHIHGRGTAAEPADGTEDTWIPLSVDLKGRVRTLAAGTGTSSDQIQGNVAHDSPDVGNPVGIGASAVTAPSATVTAGDRVRLVASLDGQLFTIAVGRVAIDAAISGNPINVAVRASLDPASQVTADSRAAMISADRYGRVRTIDMATEAYAGAEGVWTRTRGVPGAASVVLKASAGRLAWVRAYNANAALRWLQIHNASAVLSGGETPEYVADMPVSNGREGIIDLRPIGGDRLASGIVVAFSTTRDTFTAGTASDHFFTALTK